MSAHLLGDYARSCGPRDVRRLELGRYADSETVVSAHLLGGYARSYGTGDVRCLELGRGASPEGVMNAYPFRSYGTRDVRSSADAARPS